MDPVTKYKRYMKPTKTFLIITGIWPDQDKLLKYTSRFIVCFICATSLLTQCAQLVYFFSLNGLIEQLPPILGALLLGVKEATYILKGAKLRTLFNGMLNDWAIGKSEDELATMASHMQKAAIFRLFYIVNVYGCSFLFLQIPWWPRIADIIMPLNTSRPRLYILSAYYFFDMEKYYYLVILHMTIGIIVAMLVYISCDTCYVCIVQHACSLLAVAGHRFKHAIEEFSAGKKITDRSNGTYRRVCLSIQAHVRATSFLEEIDDIHSGYLFVCMGIVIAAFSVTLIMVSRMPVDSKFYTYSTYLLLQLIHLFFLTLQGQFVINSNDETYDKMYEGLWYITEPRTRALYILVLARTKISPQITAGGLITMNLQSFADIVKTSFSYFTVLKSA